MSKQNRIYVLLVILVIMLIIRFAWFPLVTQIVDGRNYVEFAEETIKSRDVSLQRSNIVFEELLVDLEQRWDQISEQAYRTSSPLLAGVALLEFVRDFATNLNLTINSLTLITPLKHYENLYVIGAQVSIAGDQQDILGFIFNLVHGNPSHKVADLLFTQSRTGLLEATFVINGLGIIYDGTPENVSPVILIDNPPRLTLLEANQKMEVLEVRDLFTSSIGEWYLTGIIYQKEKATAIMTNISHQEQYMVQVGDLLDDAIEIVDINQDSVKMKWRQTEYTLTL